MDTVPASHLLAPADWASRLAARAIDVVLLAAADGALGGLIGFGFDWLIVSASIVVTYFALMDAWVGATLGKLVVGLRVLGSDGGRPSMRQAWTREAFTVVGAIPFAGPFLALAAWVWILVTIRSSPLKQGAHDVIAGGTRVVWRPVA